ncbi:MAG: hypothetical protein V5A64_04095 [Candidatus Thermoplasmatota archaeon]
MIGIVYHEDYNKYDLGVDHPFIGDKPHKTMEMLKEKKILDQIQQFTAKKATDEDILRVHTKKYLDQIKKLSKQGGKLSADTPVPKGIYKHASHAVGGTLLAGEKLFQDFNCMVNPLGGFHHTGTDFSSGFCFFNDIAMVIEKLRIKQNIKRFMIIDIDVHHADGTQEIYYNDPSVLNISFHQDGKTLYPHTGSIEEIGEGVGRGYTINLPFPPRTGGGVFLRFFKELIPKFMKQFEPEFIIFQSGVDTHYSDPLGDLEYNFQTYYYAARRIKNLAERYCDKLLVLMGGGYNNEASATAYYNEMTGLLNQKNFVKEESRATFQQFYEANKNRKKLKEVLNSYWGL